MFCAAVEPFERAGPPSPSVRPERLFPMLLVPTYVAASAIEGVGVFAAEFIPAGTQIWRFDETLDRLIPVAMLTDHSPTMSDFLGRYSYPSPENPGFMVVEADNGRFMNHSLTPNADFTGHRGVALVDIAPGEEITCNYADFDPRFAAAPTFDDMPPSHHAVHEGAKAARRANGAG